MFLFIDTVSNPARFILFDTDRSIVASQEVTILGQEASLFLSSLESFVTSAGIRLSELTGIVIVNGPGSFTWMRIITLTVNTLAFVHKTPLFALDFFRLLSLSERDFPMCVKANRGEYLVRYSSEHNPEIVAIADMSDGHYFGIGDENDFENRQISIEYGVDYARFIRNYEFPSSPLSRIDPIYIKKPNITIKVQ